MLGVVVLVPDPEAHGSRILKLLLPGRGCCGELKGFGVASGSLCQKPSLGSAFAMAIEGPSLFLCPSSVFGGWMLVCGKPLVHHPSRQRQMLCNVCMAGIL